MEDIDALIELMACPVCHGDLEIQKDKKNLKCIKCKRNYAIKEGIPIMLPKDL
ncbi:Trm112 family protein [Candidatus Woesearchaeota archaeon]|nr:Trm112 family protein [Candidatus Woesearchaeota archaeon]